MRHRGESPATALILHPHATIDPGLPAGQKLGTADQCFFKATREDRFTGTPYDDHFELRNPGLVSDGLVEQRIASITVSDTISNGHLTAYAKLSKFPPL